MNLRSNKSTPKKVGKVVKVPVPFFKEKDKVLYIDPLEYKEGTIAKVQLGHTPKYSVIFKSGEIKILPERQLMKHIPKWRWNINRFFSRFIF
jgi:hypothetical protein